MLADSDAVRRPKVYAKEARKHLDLARNNGETLLLLERPIIRYDKHTHPMNDLYNVEHESDDGEEDDEEAEGSSPNRPVANGTAPRELTQPQKERLEKEAREKVLLETEDAQWFALDAEMQALGLSGALGEDESLANDPGDELMTVYDSMVATQTEV
jgi:hypothetical protein